MKVVSLSENTLVVLFDQTISRQTAAEVLKLKQLINKELAEFVIDIIPSYTSIHVSFNLRKISHKSFVEKVETLTQQTRQTKQADLQQNHEKNLIEIPVYYGEEVGFDLHQIADKSGLSIKQIIQTHSDKIYDVFALGFAPGFAYLGTVDEQIAIPRKETPRLSVPQGSLGIAGEQTAIYPFDSPGGWNIIGKTPIKLVDYNQQSPCIFEVGDSIKFQPISKSEFLKQGGEL
jgi:KipI family sensor histidine kinase inhibitor